MNNTHTEIDIVEVVARAIGIACERPDDYEAAKDVLSAIRDMPLDKRALGTAAVKRNDPSTRAPR